MTKKCIFNPPCKGEIHSEAKWCKYCENYQDSYEPQFRNVIDRLIEYREIISEAWLKEELYVSRSKDIAEFEKIIKELKDSNVIGQYDNKKDIIPVLISNEKLLSIKRNRLDENGLVRGIIF